MKEIPILFSAPMVRAILAGRKTQTRRILKPQPEMLPGVNPDFTQLKAIRNGDQWMLHGSRDASKRFKVKYSPGDRLWVRENHAFVGGGDPGYLLCEADWQETAKAYKMEYDGKPPKWTPSIHMPRSASRITLLILDVRVDRLQRITEADAKAEGVEQRVAGQNEAGRIKTYRTGFVYAWSAINGAESWAANPWVVALTFTDLEIKRAAA